VQRRTSGGNRSGEGQPRVFVGGVQRGMSVPRKCPWKRAVGQAGWCGGPVSKLESGNSREEQTKRVGAKVQRLRRHAFSSAAPPLHPAVSELPPCRPGRSLSSCSIRKAPWIV